MAALLHKPVEHTKLTFKTAEHGIAEFTGRWVYFVQHHSLFSPGRAGSASLWWGHHQGKHSSTFASTGLVYSSIVVLTSLYPMLNSIRLVKRALCVLCGQGEGFRKAVFGACPTEGGKSAAILKGKEALVPDGQMLCTTSIFQSCEGIPDRRVGWQMRMRWSFTSLASQHKQYTPGSPAPMFWSCRSSYMSGLLFDCCSTQSLGACFP